MELSEFIVTVTDNLLLYSTVFLLLLLIYYVLFKKTFVNIVDSFVVEMITCTGSSATVFIMYMNNSIQNKFLFSFITTELALFLGIYLIYVITADARKPPSVPEKISKTNEQYITIFCSVTSAIYLLVQIASFLSVGFVLFNDTEGVNHVNAYADDGILFGFIISITPLFLTALFVKRKIFGKFSTYDYFCIAISLLSSILSGSKSSFMVLFTAFSFVDYKFSKLYCVKKTKIPYIYIITFFSSVIAIISIGSFGSGSTPFLGLFQRILFSGDVYLLGYNDGAVKYVTKGKTALSYIFYPIYGKFAKIAGVDMTPIGVGVGLYDYTYGITTSGSTARHNYLSYIFWGKYWGSCLSFLIGLFIGLVRFFLFEITNAKNIFYLVFICTIASIVPTCITDIYLFNYLFFMLSFEFIIICLFTIFIYHIIKYYPLDSQVTLNEE